MAQRYRSTGVGQYVASERHAFWAPKHYKANGTKRGVLYFPPKGQTASDMYADFIAAAIVDAGFPICSFDIANLDGSTPQWANDTAMSRADSAFTYLTTTLGAKSDKVLIYGGSMGGLTSLNWAKRNLSLVGAVAVAIPVMDLTYVHDNDVGSSAAGIETVYGGAANWAANSVGHSPSGFGGSMTSMPTKIWYSSGDSDAFTPTHFYTDYSTAAGANTIMRDLGAVGHNTVTINASEIVSFLAPYA